MENTENLKLETPMQSIAPESPAENDELEISTETVTSPPLMNYS
jgi:hypothetical protein